MTIEVRLFANLADCLPTATGGGVATVDVPDGTTVDQLLRHLAIPDDLPRLTLVNGRDADAAQRLSAGDVVTVLPPLAGGCR